MAGEEAIVQWRKSVCMEKAFTVLWTLSPNQYYRPPTVNEKNLALTSTTL